MPDMPLLGNIVPPPSLKEMAFQAIKDAILANRLEPGKVYNEQKLANQLGISKTPVREALLELTARGFITPLPRRGFRINILTEKDIRDLYEFRNALETAIIRHITPELTEESLKQIRVIQNKEKQAIKVDDRMGYLKVDREFHLFLATLTNNHYMISALENVRDLIDWMGSKALTRQARMVEVTEEHDRIVRMLKKRDVKGAESMMAEHIRITQQNVLELMRRRPAGNQVQRANSGTILLVPKGS